jgi:hypothetical protein
MLCLPVHSACSLFHAGFLLALFFGPKNGGYVAPKRRLALTGLHGVISQKIELFIATAAKTSNPTIQTIFMKLCRNIVADSK